MQLAAFCSLTSEFFCLFRRLQSLWVTGDDLFRADILSVTGAAVLRFEYAVPEIAGGQEEHDRDGDTG